MRSRKKVLDATLGLIATDGFDGVNIAAVATAAGVSRQTVYSIFGTREDLVSQAIAGLTVDVLGDIRSHLEPFDQPADYVVELIVAGRTAVRGHPVLTTLLRGEIGNPIFDSGMISRAKPIARALLSPMVVRHPEVEEHVDHIIEVGVRLGLSVVLFDDSELAGDDELRAFLARWLTPTMEQWTTKPAHS